MNQREGAHTMGQEKHSALLIPRRHVVCDIQGTLIMNIGPFDIQALCEAGIKVPNSTLHHCCANRTHRYCPRGVVSLIQTGHKCTTFGPSHGSPLPRLGIAHTQGINDQQILPTVSNP